MLPTPPLRDGCTTVLLRVSKELAYAPLCTVLGRVPGIKTTPVLCQAQMVRGGGLNLQTAMFTLERLKTLST